MRAWFERKYPKTAGDSDGVYRAAIRAKALDTIRGMLPAATESNLGIYGTGQAYEALILRMRAHPLIEVRETADAMLVELRKVIPAFLIRVDQPDRGGRWTAYLAETRARLLDQTARIDAAAGAPASSAEVTLTDFDPDGELKVIAAALYPVFGSSRPVAPGRRPIAVDRRTCRGSGARQSASEPTGATSLAARSSARATGSTCSPTTAPSAICSGTVS